MLAEFSTPEWTIIVTVILFAAGNIVAIIRAKIKSSKEYVKFTTTVNLKIVQFQKELTEMKTESKDQIKLDRLDRKEMYGKFESINKQISELHEKIADDNEDINKSITDSEKAILKKITSLEVEHVKCKNYSLKG